MVVMRRRICFPHLTRGAEMIWIAGAALAFVFVKFGMLLILTKLLTVGLGVAILVSTALAATLIWRKGLI